jgi:DNA-binding NtrC family response regulator
LLRRHEGQIDLVITDVVMARMGGLELARRIANERPGMPIVLMSGYSAEEMPTDDPTFVFLQKPFTPSVLLQSVSTVLAHAGRPVKT